MFRASTAAAVLAAAFAVQGACVVPACAAQERAETQAPAQAEADAEHSRSAFGKVMGVMIGALQRQSRQRAHPERMVRTTAIGTPMGIEVGAAFLGDAGTTGDATPKVAPAGAAAATARATVPQEPALQDPVLRPATLAGPW